MKRIGIGTLALLSLIVMVGLLRGQKPAFAQDDVQLGWLEGTVKDDYGKGMGDWRVGLFRDGQGVYAANSNESQGGFYAIKGIRPGVYEIRVDPDTFHGSPTRNGEIRKQRLWGVAIKPGVRSVLDIRLHDGKSADFEEIGKPNVPTEKVMLLTDEIEKLKADVAELKKQIEELKKK